MKTRIHPWPAGIIATFVIFIGALAGVVVIASTHRDSLVSDDYYEEELQFQAQIDASARAQAAGASIAQDAVASCVTIQLPAAQLTEKFAGSVEFYRPSTPALDHAVKLAPAADGSQSINVAKLAAGPWLVRVKWIAAGQSYFLERKIVL